MELAIRGSPSELILHLLSTTAAQHFNQTNGQNVKNLAYKASSCAECSLKLFEYLTRLLYVRIVGMYIRFPIPPGFTVTVAISPVPHEIKVSHDLVSYFDHE